MEEVVWVMVPPEAENTIFALSEPVCETVLSTLKVEPLPGPLLHPVKPPDSKPGLERRFALLAGVK
jgi:hypothetical protein